MRANVRRPTPAPFSYSLPSYAVTFGADRQNRGKKDLDSVLTYATRHPKRKEIPCLSLYMRTGRGGDEEGDLDESG